MGEPETGLEVLLELGLPIRVAEINGGGGPGRSGGLGGVELCKDASFVVGCEREETRSGAGEWECIGGAGTS